MNAKTGRPALTIADDDLPPPRRRLPQAPPDPGDDAEVLARAEALAVRHKALQDRPAPARPQPAGAQESWKITLPDYLNAVLGRAAVERKVSKNFLVIEALMKAGYDVRPEDLVGDRRRRPKA